MLHQTSMNDRALKRPPRRDDSVALAIRAVLDSDAYRDALARLPAEADAADLSPDLTDAEYTNAVRRIAAESGE